MRLSRSVAGTAERSEAEGGHTPTREPALQDGPFLGRGASLGDNVDMGARSADTTLDRYGVPARVAFDRGTRIFLPATIAGVAIGALDLRFVPVVVLPAAWAAVRLLRVSV